MRSNPLKFLWIWQDYLRPSFWQIFAERIFASHPKRRAEYRRPHTGHQKAKKEQTMGHATLSHPSHMFRRHVEDIERCQTSLSHWFVVDFPVVSFKYVTATMNVKAYCQETSWTLGGSLWFYYPIDTTAWLAFRGEKYIFWAFPAWRFQTRAKSSWPLTIAQKSSNNIKELQETKKKPWELTELQNTWLVGGAITIFKKMSSSMGRINPIYEMENKLCSKPPTSWVA